jgi:hypothetical protein
MAGHAMTRPALIVCFALITGLLPTRAPASPLATAAPLTDAPADRAGAGEITSTDASLQRSPVSAEPAPAANPLWAIPLSTLSETRERPLFAPSRRPPPVVADSRPHPPERLPPRAAPPEQPPLKLIGTIVGEARGFGLFIDTSSKDVVRLSTGTSYHGWLLRTVRERVVVMEKNHLNQTLSLPTPPPVQPATVTSPPEQSASTDGDARLQHRLQRAPFDATNAYR